jgi:hypothetical protein
VLNTKVPGNSLRLAPFECEANDWPQLEAALGKFEVKHGVMTTSCIRVRLLRMKLYDIMVHCARCIAVVKGDCLVFRGMGRNMQSRPRVARFSLEESGTSTLAPKARASRAFWRGWGLGERRQGGPGERRKLPQWGLGRSPSRQRF